MHRKHPILIVEDSDEDFYTAERVLRKFVESPLERCSLATDVLPHLESKHETGSANAGAEPSLILLDLNLPGKRDGRDVLAQLKSDRRYRRIPVVVMTTSSNPSDVRHCFDNGASGYIVKPVNLDKFVESMEALVKYWFHTVALSANAERVV